MLLKRITATCQYSNLLFYVVLMLGAAIVVGDGRFATGLKSSILVQTGKEARFPWNYTVDNRLADFSSFSPRWSFYNSSGYEFIIGYENRIENWAWEVTHDTCPPRLLIPEERVNKTSVATLVIKNVSTADNGIYGCTLVLSVPKTSKMKLVVTVTPQIMLDKIKRVLENDNLTVTCSAIGPPTPNITWMRNNQVLASGVNGSAVLKIYNIRRDQNGDYVCQAENNPEEPVQMKTIKIIVQYPVECNKNLSTKSVKACLGDKQVKLKSFAIGVPVPTHVWYLPNKNMVKSESRANSTYTIEVLEDKHVGNWTVNVTNGINHCLHTVVVIKDDDCRKCATLQIVGFVIGFIIAIAIIAVIAVAIYRKKKAKKEWKDLTTAERVLIPLGLLVAIVIIIVVIVFITKCA